MKRELLKGVCLAFLVWLPMLLFAQGDQSVQENFKFLTWTASDPDDWSTGLLYALLGVVGAMTTIFGFIGGAIPGTAGKAKIDKQQAELDKCMERLDALINSPNIDADAINAVQNIASNLRDYIRSEQWKQFRVAMILYAFLGAMFATILADSYLQALIIGAGWTAVIGTLGLKKDYQERKDEKDELNKKLINQLERVLATAPAQEDEAEDEDNSTAVRRSRSAGLEVMREQPSSSRSLEGERDAFEKLKSEATVVNKL